MLDTLGKSPFGRSPAMRALMAALSIPGVDAKEITDDNRREIQREAQQDAVKADIDLKNARLEQLKQVREAIEQNRGKRGYKVPPREMERLNKEIFSLNAAIEDARREMERLSKPGASPWKALGMPSGWGPGKSNFELTPPSVSDQMDWGDVKPPKLEWPTEPMPAPPWVKEMPTSWGDPKKIGPVSRAAGKAHHDALLKAANAKPIKTRWDDSLEAQRDNTRANQRASQSSMVPKKERKSSLWGDPAATSSASDVTSALTTTDELAAVRDWRECDIAGWCSRRR